MSKPSTQLLLLDLCIDRMRVGLLGGKLAIILLASLP